MAWDAPTIYAGAAARIRQAREAKGQEADALARKLGMSIHEYDDLEAYDHEVSTTISLRKLRALTSALGLPVGDLLGGVRSAGVGTTTMDDVVARIVENLERSRESMEAFSERVGWDVASAVSSPSRAWDDWNLDCLVAVCSAVSCDWLAVLE